jgi:uncharacterized SAM-dependent methyltransferase
MYQIQFGKGQTGIMPITAENVCPSEVLSEFAADVSTGLSKSQKELPAKYLYDEVGSALFEAITVLPEYGLTRAEERLLGPARWRDRTSASIGRGGGGTGKRKRPQNSTFTGSHCLAAGFRFLLRDRHFTHSSGPLLQSIEWGERCGGAWLTVPVSGGTRGICSRRHGDDCLLVLFLGSSIGNFEPDQAVRFLTAVRKRLRPGDALLLGADLVKPLNRLLAAYDDPTGVTAAFNLNLLARINRELGGNFNLRNFRHAARWHARENHIEMHLRSETRQMVEIPGADCQVEFEAGETIWTESSQKFEADDFQLMAGQTGFISVARWIDTEWPFVESLWIA